MDRELSAALAWQRLADALAVPGAEPALRLGGVALLPHQREAVARLRVQLETRRVALLADATGLGKTYVACALAREARAPLVVAPTALRHPWRQAARDTGVALPFVSHEALSRGEPAAAIEPDLVIIDEAHHARTPTTRRWQALARICRGARVLCLTATPIHNRLDDLAALFALAWGDAAWQASAATLLQGIVRREVDDVRGVVRVAVPEVAPWIWHAAPDAPHVVAALEAVPAAVPPVDGREAAPLWRLGLARAWASSSAALLAAVRRRLARGAALAQALDDGRDLTRAELARWTDDDAVTPMLALDDGPRPTTVDRRVCRAAIAAHLDGLRAVSRLAREGSSDAARAALVCATLDAGRDPTRNATGDATRDATPDAAHGTAPDTRGVLFTTYAATAEMYWHHLRQRPGTALATGRGGRIASGPVDRAQLFEALDRDGPAARHVRDQVRLLIATDVASEGLTLSAASLVWHADLPWTPARVTQRVGRLARLGSRHATVTVHAFAPPGSTEERLRQLPRLAAKAATASAVAVDGSWLPRAAEPAAPSHAEAWASLRRLAEARRHDPPGNARPGVACNDSKYVPAAVLVAAHAGCVALVQTADGPELWSFGSAGPPDVSPVAAWRLLGSARAPAAAPAAVPEAAASTHRAPEPRAASTPLVAAARARVRRALARHRACGQVMEASRATPAPGTVADRGPGRRRGAGQALLARLGRELRLVPPPQRASASADAARWRERLARPLAAGWAPAIAALAASPARGVSWWDQATALAARLAPARGPSPIELRAVFVLVTEPGTR